MKKHFFAYTILSLSLSVGLISCKKDTVTPDPTPAPSPSPAYTVPTSYNFSNLDYNDALNRLNMLGEMITYIRTAHTNTAASQPTLSAQKLKDMYANAGSPFSTATLNTLPIQIKNQTSNQFGFVTDLENSFTDCQQASITGASNPTVTTASSGVAGKLVSPARAILVDANGFEFKEITEKGLMGSFLYYKALLNLTTIASFDNSAVVNGSTAQEKAWDEAFGYFGVPTTFPTSTVGLKYWGSYCNSVSSAINSNATMMNNFLKGRAAISNKDNTARDEAKNALVAMWEKVSAAKCISYLKGAKNNLSDQATLHHNLSEAHGFVKAFRYNTAKTISDTDINTLLGYFGTNLYSITTTNIDAAISKLEVVFGLNAALIP